MDVGEQGDARHPSIPFGGMTKRQEALAGDLAVDARDAAALAEPAAELLHRDLEPERVARDDDPLEADLVDPREQPDPVAEARLGGHVAAIVWASASTWMTPGMTGRPGKWPWKNHSVAVTALIPTIRFSAGSYSTIRSTRRNGQRCGMRPSITVVENGAAIALGRGGRVGCGVGHWWLRMGSR